MDPVVFLLALAFALICGLAAGIFWLAVELKAMQKSTHQFHLYNPFGKDAPEFSTLTEEAKERFAAERGEGDYLI